MSKVWFITGSTRGIGKELALAILKSGNKVVATGRQVEALEKELGASNENLLNVALDVTKEETIAAAVNTAVDKFGKIDVLVNNAGYGQLGAFEDSSMQEVRDQFETNFFGLLSVSKAVVPLLRKQRNGHVFNISSIAGLKGMFGASLYCASKFAVEGFSQALAAELQGFGVHVTCVSPGFFRTDFLESTQVKYCTSAIDDYAQAIGGMKTFYEGKNHQQAGDPVKLAHAMLQLAALEKPPVSWVAGTDAVAFAQGVIKAQQEQLDAFKELSNSTDGTW